MPFRIRRLPAWPALLLMFLLPGLQAWAQEEVPTPSWSSVTVAVADLDQALQLWVGNLGFSKLAEAEGEDPELATLWRLLPSDIQRQALLGLPGSSHGRLHLVQFTEPGPAIREGAQVYDAGPQSLVLLASNLTTRVKELQDNGLTFYSAAPVASQGPDGSVFRQIRLGIHDQLNLVLREFPAASEGFNDRGFSNITALVNVVEFAAPEQQFLVNVLGLQPGAERSVEGTELEQLMGLSSGAILDIISLGAVTQAGGQLELNDYRSNMPGADLYPVAVPTQLGILHLSIALEDIDAFTLKLQSAGFSYSDREYREVIYGKGRFVRFRTPAGFTIEVFE
jgi:catechol 2,3-dioxygenase-like lactoylglutathione lyase family enzyme